MADQLKTAVRRSVFVSVFEVSTTIATTNPVQFELRIAPPAKRWSLRGEAASLAQLDTATAFDLTQPINVMRTTSNGCMSVRLGPDEWLLISGNADAGVADTAVASGLSGAAHTLVDISHRNVAIELSGSQAADVLNTGCPLDLGNKAFPVGSATRTLYAKAEIVLIRLPDENALPRFRIECWRSFGRYLHEHLKEAAELLGIAHATSGG